MKKLFILLLALVALAALGWFAIYKIKAPAIQADIQKRSHEALASNNLDWVQVHVDGRDITLSGMARTGQLKQHAVDTANVYGVNRLIDNLMVQSTTVAEPERLETKKAEVESEHAQPIQATKQADADVAVEPVDVKTNDVPYRMNIVRDDVGVYQFDGVIPNAEFKQAVDEHLVSLGVDPLTARWSVDMSSGQEPKNWQENTLKGLNALHLLKEGSLSFKGGNALIKGVAASQNVSDRAEAVAQELAGDYERMDVAFTIAAPQKTLKVAEPTPIVGSAKYAEKFCQAEFNGLLKQEKIQFESGSTQLQGSSLQLLEKVVQVAARCPDHRIQINGYTDSRGAAANNKKLSQARAEAVLAFLVRLGVEEKRLQAVGRGEARPIASNKTESGRAKNRRIELIVKGLKK